MALIWAVASVPGLRHIYGTLWMLLIAFTVGVLAASVQITSGAVRQISRELEDAALVSGASPLRVAVEITGRLLLPSLLFAWFLAAIMIIGDLDAPLMLSSAGTQTISIEIYNLFENSLESQAAALLTLVLASILVCSGLWAAVKVFLRAALHRQWVRRAARYDPEAEGLLSGKLVVGN